MKVEKETNSKLCTNGEIISVT